MALMWRDRMLLQGKAPNPDPGAKKFLDTEKASMGWPSEPLTCFRGLAPSFQLKGGLM